MRSGMLCVLLVFALGCGGGDSGPQRYRVSGKVTFNGKPVPAGSIYFETSEGPSGGAQIIDGNYDTDSGKGVVGGPHDVVIQGFDGTGSVPGELGKPIFNPFRVREEFPKGETTKDYEVPASAAEGLDTTSDPA
ncbi:MAG: hypothetical protein U0936_17195 [Planctomycetaceae bacterium]